jgi:sporulation protein YlmC with PRC-barrel domain
MITHRNIAEWHGKQLVDCDGDKIGKLEDVYVDVETDEPMFGTVKEDFGLNYTPPGTESGRRLARR